MAKGKNSRKEKKNPRKIKKSKLRFLCEGG